MLRSTVIRNAAQAVDYYGAELGTSQYYLKQKGVWFGKLRTRLALSPEVTKKDFVALMNNVKPGAGGEVPGTRLTARTNTTRKKTVWELDEQSQTRVQVEKEVSNRRVAVDWTFSLEKDKSVYLAAAKDNFFESCVHRVLMERLEAIEKKVQTRIRIGGVQDSRTAGESLFGVFIHRTTRPINGTPDCHWHAHCVQANVAWDEQEQRFKAAELEKLFSTKAYEQAVFHARLNEVLIDVGYGFRRTDKGLEMTVMSRAETRIFCKRTQEIEALEEKLRSDFNRKASAIVTAAAAKGQLLEHDVVYGKLKDKLGERTRKGKDTAIVDGQALEAEWSKQLAPGRWEAITPEAARNGDRIDFLDLETAKTLAIQHAFEQKSVIRDVDLFKAIAVFGCGTMSVSEMDTFCRKDPRLVRNLEKPGEVTTWEIVSEEQFIRDVVTETRGKYEPLCADSRYQVQDKQLDAGQFGAIKLVLENRDLAVAVPGYTGSGKSRTVREAAHAVKTLTGHSPLVLAPTGRAAKALGFAAGANETHTIASFRANERLQKQAVGRSIFVDEFSLINNADGKWLLDLARANGCRLTFWGDGAQHVGVSRGCPIVDLLDAGLLEYRQLNVIYRQTNKELLAAVQDAADGKFQASVDKVKAWMRVEDNEQVLRAKLVEALVEKHERSETVLAIALMHAQGEAIARDVRAKLKQIGALGTEDIQVKTLKDVHLTDAQRSDA
jgi:conjugative relaxase-like TrwC/TraI family protein